MINASSHSVSDFCIRGTTVNKKRKKKNGRIFGESRSKHIRGSKERYLLRQNIDCFVLINSVLWCFSCVWILFQNAIGHYCFRSFENQNDHSCFQELCTCRRDYCKIPPNQKIRQEALFPCVCFLLKKRGL